MHDYTRVTEVLSVFSGLDRIPEAILKNAADRGSKIHEICDAIISGLGVPEIDENLSGYIQSFNLWYPKDFIQKPERFFCDKYMITGECDGIYKENDELVLVDFKTPLKKSSTWPLQLSAYKYLAQQSGFDIKHIEVVRLKKDGKKPEVLRYDDSSPLFFHCLDVYRYFYKSSEQDNYIDYI